MIKSMNVKTTNFNKFYNVNNNNNNDKKKKNKKSIMLVIVLVC